MIPRNPIFTDRAEAGRKLASALEHLRDRRPLVLALPRGGVPVAFQVAEALDAPLDLLFVRKIGAPDYPELGVGAVVDGADPQIVINDEVRAELGVSSRYIEEQAGRELEEIERRREAWMAGREPTPVRGRTVIVVDDGVATGGTVRAALKALSKAGASRVVLAVPVAPTRMKNRLREEADEVVCLASPEPFYAVGQAYVDFVQTDDTEVVRLLDRAAARPDGRQHEPPSVDSGVEQGF